MNKYLVRVVEDRRKKYNVAVEADWVETEGYHLKFFDKEGGLVAAFPNYVYFKEIK